jgi:hypothetical protein
MLSTQVDLSLFTSSNWIFVKLVCILYLRAVLIAYLLPPVQYSQLSSGPTLSLPSYHVVPCSVLLPVCSLLIITLSYLLATLSVILSSLCNRG